MRTVSNRMTGGGIALILALAVGGCGKVAPKGAPDTGKPRAEASASRAEAQRHRVACASSVAYGRLKSIVFDQAVDRHDGDRANLDTLADYSVVRIEDPVVDGWDPALDLTRCTGRFIVQIPPGAERAFGGARRLQADIDYTAQAAADGSGFVYRLNGAEPIIARLAAFNLSTAAYRPSPAIDQGQDDATGSGDVAMERTTGGEVDRLAPDRAAGRPAEVAERDPASTTAERRRPLPMPADGETGEATVRRFYAALGDGDGRAASAQIVPEKRTSRAFSPEAIARFYGPLAEPIRLTGIVPLAGGAYRVSYRYSAGRSRCAGRAVVRLADRGGRDLIRSIDALNGC